MAKAVRMSTQTLRLLEELLVRPTEWRYGYDLSRGTALKSGTLYPLLMRLARHHLLEAQWRVMENGTPPRHMYRLTPAGLRFAQERLRETQLQSAVRHPAYAGSES